MYQFNYESKLRLILKTFGLETVAQMSNVEKSITLDGAELCDYKSHLTAGMKITDKRAVASCTKQPLCSSTGKHIWISCVLRLKLIYQLIQSFFFITENILGAVFNCQS